MRGVAGAVSVHAGAAPPHDDLVGRYGQALLSLVELLHYCALIGRELHSDASITMKIFHPS